MSALVQKRIRMRGLIILDHYAERFDAFRATWASGSAPAG
jgi:NADPH-dependent curcumin reductase